ncbi:MAG: tRNA dihydrouridine synthase DusB [Elusimicrobiota bacterium]
MPHTVKISGYLRPLLIGKLKLRNNIFLAPMAGITDGPFRRLAIEGGAGLVCSEMVSSKALAHGHKRTHKMLELTAAEHPVSIQIFGPDPESMAAAAKTAEQCGADIIDINFGCPVPKIAKSGAGAVLLSNEKAASAIMESTSKAVRIPVTAKIRIGRNSGENIAPRFVNIAEENGISAVIIHGRPAASGHKGAPDLDAIRKAGEFARIPVIGNGGITNETSALNFFERTDCDGIMIGRGAIGDFGIFARIEHFLNTGEKLPDSTWETRIDNFRKHAELAVELYGEKRGLIRMRKIVAYYLKDMPGASSIRNRFCKIESVKEMDGLLSNMRQSPHFD